MSAWWPWPLTFDLTLKLVRNIARGAYNHPTNFGKSRSFRSRLIGQQLSDASRDISTLTIDLGGHSARRWCGSSSSGCVLSLKFVGLSVRKIWRTSGLNIMSAWWPWPLIFDLETGMHFPVGCITFLPILVFLGRFFLDFLGQNLSDASHDFATLTFDLGGHSACRWYGLRSPSVHQVWSS